MNRLIALAVSTAARSPALPDVPTIAEVGLPGYVFDHWYGMFAPAKTPRTVVNQISQEVARVLNIPDIKDTISAHGAVVKPSTPEEFGKFVRAEVEKITKVMKAGRVKVIRLWSQERLLLSYDRQSERPRYPRIRP